MQCVICFSLMFGKLARPRSRQGQTVTRWCKQLESALEKEKAELTAAMADPELYSGDAEKVVALQKDLGWVQNRLNEAEEAWLDLQAQLEQM